MQYAILKQLKVHILFTVSTPPTRCKSPNEKKNVNFFIVRSVNNLQL